MLALRHETKAVLNRRGCNDRLRQRTVFSGAKPLENLGQPAPEPHRTRCDHASEIHRMERHRAAKQFEVERLVTENILLSNLDETTDLYYELETFREKGTRKPIE